MAGTTMYATKAALLGKLQDDISGVQITYGDSGGAMRRESIFLGDITSNEQTPQAFASGRRRLIEDYTVDVHVAVQSKTNLQEAEERAIALATSVENVINDYPTLSGAVTGLMFIECSGISMSTAEAGVDGPRAFVTVHARVKGKLQ